MKKKDEGFTLIELLIVIVILGILATVVVFAVSGIRDQGDTSACNTEKRTVQTAIEAFYADTRAYPTSDADLDDYLRTDLQYFTLSGGGAAYPTVSWDASVSADPPTDCTLPVS